MLDVSPEDIKEDSLLRVTALLAIPLVAQNVVQVAQQIVDIFWVGRLGENAVAAVGLTFPVVALLFSVHVGLMTAIRIRAARQFGDDDADGAGRTVFHGATLMGLSGVVLALVVSGFAPDVMALVGNDPAVLALAATYLAVLVFELPILGLSDALEAGFVAWGDTRTALYVNVVAVGVNLVLDPILILGWGPVPRLGVEGAALATILGYLAGFALAFAMAMGLRDTFVLHAGVVGFDFAEYRRLVSVGYPVSIRQFASQGVNVVVIWLVSVAGGAAALAAYTLGMRMSSLAAIPAWGLQQASETVVGQNAGAGNSGRANRAVWTGAGIAVTLLLALGAVQWLAPRTLALAFVPSISADGLALTVEYLRVLALGYWAVGATNLFIAGFNAAERTGTGMVITLARDWLVRLPVAAAGVLVLGLGVSAVFWSSPIAHVAAALGAGAYFQRAARNGLMDRPTASATADD